MSSTSRKAANKTPKTPARGRKDNREPLTPGLTHALNGLKLNKEDPSSSSFVTSTMGEADISVNPFLETSIPLGQSLKNTAIFGGGGGSASRTQSSRPNSRPGSRNGSRPNSRAGSRSGSPNKRSKSAHGPKNTVNLYGMETKLDIIEISAWPLNKKDEKKDSSNEATPRRRTKSQSNAVSIRLFWVRFLF
jgi:hypothetical protein